MGVIQSEYIIAKDLYAKDEEVSKKKVLDWIKSIDEDYQCLFCLVEGCMNSEFTFFMNWDGSKEGWETSEKADDLRVKFKEVLKENFEFGDILHIKPRGEIVEEDIIIHEEIRESELECPCVVCNKEEEVQSGMCENCLEEAIRHFKLKRGKNNG